MKYPLPGAGHVLHPGHMAGSSDHWKGVMIMRSFLIAFLSLLPSAASGEGWVSSSLPFGDFAESPSMQCDPSGNPCIAYIHHPENNINHLHFARFDGENWTDDLLDFTVRDPDVAIDSNGLAHISARDYANSCIMYYYQNPDMTWSMETAHASVDLGPYDTRIVLDAFDNPHICYYLYDSSLLYLFKDGNDWSVYEGLGNCCAPDLALSESGLPHISHSQQPGYGGTIFCSFVESGEWYTAPIASSVPFQNVVTRITFDSADTPHVLWSDNGSLNHTTDAGPAWQTEVLYPYQCTLMDMAMLPDDNLCAVYAVSEALDFARMTSSGWAFEQVTNKWGEAALAADGAGDLYIAFVDDSDKGFEMVLFQKDISSGIESFVSEQVLLQTSPNPSTGNLNLTISNGYTGQVEAFLFDLQGRVVFSSKCYASGGGASLDLSGLDEGVYLLSLGADSFCKTRITILR